MSDNSPTDWEAIEREYRLGRESVRAIATRHGVSDTLIRRRARKKMWTRDLSDEVKTRTKAHVNRLGYKDKQKGGADPVDPERAAREEAEAQELADSLAASRDATDEDIAEQAAAQNAAVINRHRKNLNEWQYLTCLYRDRLKEQLEAGKMTVMVKGAKVKVDLPLDYIGKAMTAGTQSLERLINAERRTYNLDADDDVDEGKSIDELMAEAREDG